LLTSSGVELLTSATKKERYSYFLVFYKGMFSLTFLLIPSTVLVHILASTTLTEEPLMFKTVPGEYEPEVWRRVCSSKTIDTHTSSHVVGKIAPSNLKKLTAG
jgi:hypothetical protein